MREHANTGPTAARWRAAVGTTAAVGAMALLAACSGSTDTPATTTAAPTPVASASVSAPAFPTRYFDDQVDLVYTAPGGTPTREMTGPPVPGARLELTENLYAGDHSNHAAPVAGTNRTVCAFDAQLESRCTSKATFGNSTLETSSTGSNSDFVATITGGTGRFAGATGTIHVHSLGDTNDADILLNLK
ncbi:MAG: hypothetical protein ACQSGP_22340 [Frankia sp.]